MFGLVEAPFRVDIETQPRLELAGGRVCGTMRRILGYKLVSGCTRLDVEVDKLSVVRAH